MEQGHKIINKMRNVSAPQLRTHNLTSNPSPPPCQPYLLSFWETVSFQESHVSCQQPAQPEPGLHRLLMVFLALSQGLESLGSMGVEGLVVLGHFPLPHIPSSYFSRPMKLWATWNLLQMSMVSMCAVKSLLLICICLGNLSYSPQEVRNRCFRPANHCASVFVLRIPHTSIQWVGDKQAHQLCLMKCTNDL